MAFKKPQKGKETAHLALHDASNPSSLSPDAHKKPPKRKEKTHPVCKHTHPSTGITVMLGAIDNRHGYLRLRKEISAACSRCHDKLATACTSIIAHSNAFSAISATQDPTNKSCVALLCSWPLWPCFSLAQLTLSRPRLLDAAASHREASAPRRFLAARNAAAAVTRTLASAAATTPSFWATAARAQPRLGRLASRSGSSTSALSSRPTAGSAGTSMASPRLAVSSAACTQAAKPTAEFASTRALCRRGREAGAFFLTKRTCGREILFYTIAGLGSLER